MLLEYSIQDIDKERKEEYYAKYKTDKQIGCV